MFFCQNQNLQNYRICRIVEVRGYRFERLWLKGRLPSQGVSISQVEKTCERLDTSGKYVEPSGLVEIRLIVLSTAEQKVSLWVLTAGYAWGGKYSQVERTCGRLDRSGKHLRQAGQVDLYTLRNIRNGVFIPG